MTDVTHEPAAPEAAHVREQSTDATEQWRDRDDADLEATELHDVTNSPAAQPSEAANASSADGPSPDTSPLQLRPTVGQRRKAPTSALGRFWVRHVVVAVPHNKCRDHLALERTFLSYLRTSSELALTATVVAQAFRLQKHSDTKGFSLYGASEGLAVMLIIAAIAVILTGAYRFWWQQNAMCRGKILAGGWEIHLTCGLFGGCSVILLVMILLVRDD